MELHSKIYVAGHTGLVGSAIVNCLRKNGYDNIITAKHIGLDLTRQLEVEEFFEKERPEYVFLAAAKVGGIYANNTYRADFIYVNLQIQNNVIHSAYKFGAKKILLLGSSCIYPRDCPQPMIEEYLLTGPLEQTNEPYAIAKIAGLKMCESYNRQYGSNFISCMPTNVYGPGDNFHPVNSHVIPALMRRFHETKLKGEKQVVVWGTGNVSREFLFIDDLADACVFLMNNYNENRTINIGSGKEVMIKELASIMKEVVEFNGQIVFDSSKPDGTPRKLLDSSRIMSMGWKATTGLFEGLCLAYKSFKSRVDQQGY